MFTAISPTNAGRRNHPLGSADGAEVEILNILDDHSRLCLATDARRITKGGDVGRQLPH